MKRKRLKLTMLFACSMAVSINANAQLSGDRAFMIGDYVEVGINANGFEGAELVDSIPTHARGFTGKLGFVSNPAADGWIDYDGDFYLPGSPENGFGLTYTLSGTTFHRANNAMGLDDIPGEIVSVTDNLDSTIVVWVGEIDDLELTITYELQKDQHHYSTTMNVANLGDETFTDVYYYRTLDPDNNQDISWSFATTNTIESQSEMDDDSVRVSATSEVDWLSEMIFHAYGENWKGYTGGFANRNGASMWNGLDGLNIAEDYTITADQAIGLSYKIESLPPGKAGSEEFSFATVFNREEFFSSEPVDDSGIGEFDVDFKLYPNPTTDKLINIEVEGAFNYEIADIKGQVVMVGNSNNTTILDLNSLEKGIYFITLTQGKKSSNQKLIIQ